MKSIISGIPGWPAGVTVMAATFIVTTVAVAEEPTTNTLIIHADQGHDTISRNLYGQFSEDLGRCIYGGIWVGEDSSIPNTRGIRNDIVAALKKIKVPVLRWPGGCYADDYHWMDGVGPRGQRPKTVNTSWGNVLEDNQFGTHEFLDFCRQIGAEPYLAGNMGSGTVREMADWIEYLTCAADTPMARLRRENGRDQPWHIPFLGIGNESWGCGGNMTPEYYADNFLRYNTFIKNYDGNQIFRIASGASDADYHWTEVLMRRVGPRMDGLSLHYYTTTTGVWSHKGSATDFDETGWFETLHRAQEINTLVTRHAAVMDRYDPEKKVGLVVDEWGTWYDPDADQNLGILYQQNTLRDALVAGVTLNILNQHCDRVKMACIAQMVNVLQAMILTDGNKMIVTPTYYVFQMYTVHHDATLLPSELHSANYQVGVEQIPGLSVSVSRSPDGEIHVSLCNLNPNRPAEVACELDGARVHKISGVILTAPGMNAHNSFDQPDQVKPAEFNAFKKTENGFVTTLPGKSVVMLELK